MTHETPEQYRERMMREHGEGWAMKTSPALKTFCDAMAHKYRRFKTGWAYHCTSAENDEFKRLYCEATRREKYEI